MANFFIRRPIVAIVISILIVLLGLFNLKSLSVEQYPFLAPPTIRVTANYPGANAKVVSESLLGGMVVVLDPGGDKTMLKAGGEIQNTQDAISFTELLARFMFSGTGSK